MSERFALGRKESIKFNGCDVIAFQKRPGIVMGILGVDSTNDVDGQPSVGLVSVESLKWTGEDDPTKVPQDGANWLICHRLQARRANIWLRGRIAPFQQAGGGSMNG